MPGAYERRYVLLAVCVFGLLLSHTLNQQWSSDFWEHSAAVRELSLRPLHPRHPVLALDAPHQSYSLYTWGIALAVRWLRISPIAALSAAALLNAGAVLLFFPLAVSALSRRRDLSFYALLFTLVLWGPRPWRFSGFLNLNSLGFVLPFPSMFATAIAFLVIGLTPSLLRSLEQSLRRVLPAGALIFLVVNAHPITGAPLIVAMLAIAAACRPTVRGWLGLALAIELGVLLAVSWPLYPLLAVAFAVRDIGLGNRPMYEHVLLRTAPALLGIPLLLRRVRTTPLDPLGTLFAGLALIYAAGWWTANWTLGRVMPFLLLPLFICLAEWVVDRERAGPVGGGGRARSIPLRLLVAAVLVGTSVTVAPGLVRAVPQSWLPPAVRAAGQLEKPAAVFAFLQAVLTDADVVMAPADISIIVPTFGGKVVVGRHHLFVYDEAMRRADRQRFFATGDQAEARAILDKYGVTKILVDKSGADETSRLRALGVTVFTNDRYEVIAVRR